MSADNRKASLLIPFTTVEPMVIWGGEIVREFTCEIKLPLWLTRIMAAFVSRKRRR